MLIVISCAQAAPGRRDELVSAARAVAEATRRDSGCLSYWFAAHVEDDERIMGVETWADRASLDAHMGHPHTEQFLRQVPDLVAGPPDMTFHDVPDPR